MHVSYLCECLDANSCLGWSHSGRLPSSRWPQRSGARHSMVSAQRQRNSQRVGGLRGQGMAHTGRGADQDADRAHRRPALPPAASRSRTLAPDRVKHPFDCW